MTTTPAMPELPDGATVLPDGSAFAIASFPLPSDHWLYAPREYRDGEEEPIELPPPILSHQAHGDVVRAAIRYAVRSATMCGKEPDFDPDALVQNAMYALCGPFGLATLQAKPAEVSDEPEQASKVVNDSCWKFIDAMPHKIPGPIWNDLKPAIYAALIHYHRAILALRPQAVPMTEGQATYKQAEGSKNCMQCAAAYMLGRPLAEVPDFEQAGPQAWDSFYEFFEGHGFTAEMFPPTVEITGDYLASGDTDRGTSHMVVMRGGKLLHDPHPSNAGLKSVQVVWLITRRAGRNHGITAPAGGEG